MTEQEMAAYLKAQGWRERPGHSPWRWYKPPYNGALHALKHAYMIQKAMSKEGKYDSRRNT